MRKERIPAWDFWGVQHEQQKEIQASNWRPTQLLGRKALCNRPAATKRIRIKMQSMKRMVEMNANADGPKCLSNLSRHSIAMPKAPKLS